MKTVWQTIGIAWGTSTWFRLDDAIMAVLLSYCGRRCYPTSSGTDGVVDWTAADHPRLLLLAPWEVVSRTMIIVCQLSRRKFRI